MLKRVPKRQEIDYQLARRPVEGMDLGEVMVRVKVTNPFDLADARRGMITPDRVRSIESEALVDTGAVNCVLPSQVADQLGLARVMKQTAQHPGGREEEADMTEPALFELLGRKVYEECLILGDEILIGQTALESTDLFVDCRSGRLIPNPAHPNQPVIKIRGAS